MLTVQTDPASAGIKNTRALERHFPQATLLQTGLCARLGQLGIDHDKQVEPLLHLDIAAQALSSSQLPLAGGSARRRWPGPPELPRRQRHTALR